MKLTRAALCCHSIALNVKTMICNKKSINRVCGSVSGSSCALTDSKENLGFLTSLGFGLSFEFSHFIKQDLEI